MIIMVMIMMIMMIIMMMIMMLMIMMMMVMMIRWLAHGLRPLCGGKRAQRDTALQLIMILSQRFRIGADVDDL